MTTQEKDARIEELCERFEEQKIEFHCISESVHYHMHLSLHAYVVMVATMIIIGLAYLFFAQTWFQIGLCLALQVAAAWNMYDRTRVAGFFVDRQGEEVQKLDDLTWEIAKLKDQTEILNFFRACSGIPPRFD